MRSPGVRSTMPDHNSVTHYHYLHSKPECYFQSHQAASTHSLNHSVSPSPKACLCLYCCRSTSHSLILISVAYQYCGNNEQ
jgi:hypothetical protein